MNANRERAALEAVKDLQTRMDDLRVSTKYLAFDLEATRRERDSALRASRLATMWAHGMENREKRQQATIERQLRELSRQRAIIALYKKRCGE